MANCSQTCLIGHNPGRLITNGLIATNWVDQANGSPLTTNSILTGCQGHVPTALSAKKYAPNKRYALNKQYYCVYAHDYDNYSVLMLAYTFT